MARITHLLPVKKLANKLTAISHYFVIEFTCDGKIKLYNKHCRYLKIMVKSKLTTCAVSIVLAAIPSICSAFFSDVDKDNIYYQPIYFLHSNNLIVGYPDNTYKPNEYLIRSIAAKVVLSAYENDDQYKLSIAEPDPSNTFMDASYDSWFTKYMLKAEEYEAFSRDADGYFKPYDPLTRAQFMKLVLAPSGLDLESYDDVQLYSDVPEYAWFAKYMNFAGTFGLIVADKDNNLRPSDIVNRGEAAETGYLLYLMLKKDNTEMVLKELEANIDQTLHYTNIGKDFAARRSAAIAIGLGQNLYNIDNKNSTFLANAQLAKANAYSVNYHILKAAKSPEANQWLELAQTKLDEAVKTDSSVSDRANSIKQLW